MSAHGIPQKYSGYEDYRELICCEEPDFNLTFYVNNVINEVFLQECLSMADMKNVEEDSFICPKCGTWKKVLFKVSKVGIDNCTD